MNTKPMWAILVLVSVSSAWAGDAEKFAMARLRLSTESTVATGCRQLGLVSDDSIKDIRKKIVRAGGDTGVLSFGESKIHAQVFLCAGTPQPATNAHPVGSPPAAGIPPTAPSGASR